MKSLNDNYVSTHGSTHETFTDLMFCALVVLVLFVLALAIEVSQRVRSSKKEVEAVATTPIPVLEEQELSELTKEEVAQLSKKMQEQQLEIVQLKISLQQRVAEIESQEQQVQAQLSALNGEQRFTGAREPASLRMAYDYRDEKFYFVSSRESEHADSQNSGESFLEYSNRKTKEFVAIALKARKQRGFSLEEAKAIYRAFSTYKEVEPSDSGYEIVDSELGISYHTHLSGYIVGETEMSSSAVDLVEMMLLQVYREESPPSDEMYPRVTLVVDAAMRTVKVNGIEMDAKSIKEILLSIGGRGAMLDLEGISGAAPDWFREDVLIPAGYISKVPKLPGQ